MTRFIDRVVVHARAGNGGNGCASVHREKFKPLGGPDGGNGGRGGSVVFVVDPQIHTLLDFHFHPHVVAPSGKQGAGSNRDGAAGADLEVKVPDGTVVLDERGRMLADLVCESTSATTSSTWSARVPGSMLPPEGGAGWATPPWLRVPVGRPALRCWVRGVKSAISRSSSRQSPTSG